MASRILIVDDHPSVRQTLRWLLEGQPGYEVVGEAADGEQAVAMVADLQPHVVLMDVQMPVVDGVEATRRICQQHPHVRIIGISLHNDDSYARRMITTGAHGYLTKDCAFDELLRAINEVAGGGTYLASNIADMDGAR